jgi:hypothetical protein
VTGNKPPLSFCDRGSREYCISLFKLVSAFTAAGFGRTVLWAGLTDSLIVAALLVLAPSIVGG